MATDKELNEYMSVKKYAPYRLAKADKHRFGKAQQEKLRELKTKVAERTGGAFGFDVTSQTDRDSKPKKRKGKKERMRMKSELDAGDDEISGLKERKWSEGDIILATVGAEENGYSGVDEESVPKKRRKRKHKKEDQSNAVEA